MNLLKQYYVLKRLIVSAGTKDWLIGTEIKYGGRITNVSRNKVSPYDPRTIVQLKNGGMSGGDRMLYLGYAKDYARYLKHFINSSKTVFLAEVGILKGTGLAIWCDLFKNGKILGLDIDLSHFENNLEHLKGQGAFKYNQPQTYEFDQFVDNTQYLKSILKQQKLNICIDDGFHADQTILTTLKSFMPYLAEDFVYFIEDNHTVHHKIKKLYPHFKIYHQGLMTILSSNTA